MEWRLRWNVLRFPRNPTRDVADDVVVGDFLATYVGAYSMLMAELSTPPLIVAPRRPSVSSPLSCCGRIVDNDYVLTSGDIVPRNGAPLLQAGLRRHVSRIRRVSFVENGVSPCSAL